MCVCVSSWVPVLTLLYLPQSKLGSYGALLFLYKYVNPSSSLSSSNLTTNQIPKIIEQKRACNMLDEVQQHLVISLTTSITVKEIFFASRSVVKNGTTWKGKIKCKKQESQAKRRQNEWLFTPKIMSLHVTALIGKEHPLIQRIKRVCRIKLSRINKFHSLKE